MTAGGLVRLAIVEDENNIRNLIRMSVDWSALGIQIVGEASTGLEALYLIEESAPDIVLTDIEIPYMDGLELSRRILRQYPNTQVVVLTAHAHFRYLQKALQTGVADYLLKPLDAQKIEEVMRTAVQRIKQRRASLGKTDLSLQYVQNHKRFFRDKSLESMLHSGASEGLEELLEMVNAPIAGAGRFSLALMSVERLDGVFTGAERYLVLGNSRAYIEQQFGAGGKLWVFWDGMESLAILSQDPDVDIALVCGQIIEEVEAETGCRVFVGLGAAVEGISQLPAAYKATREALRLAVLSGQSCLQPSSALPQQGEQSFEEKQRDLLLYVKNGIKDEIPGICGELLQTAVAQHGGDLNGVKTCAMQVLTSAINALADRASPWATLASAITKTFEDILSAHSIGEVSGLMEAQLALLSGHACEQQRHQNNSLVRSVSAYLEENFADDSLSLSAVAAHFSVNSSYLSRVFKAETATSFSEYLLSLRIGAAVALLRQADYKAYQLAEKVGIPDPGYFTKCFKKETGVSFQAFKQQLNEEPGAQEGQSLPAE